MARPTHTNTHKHTHPMSRILNGCKRLPKVQQNFSCDRKGSTCIGIFNIYLNICTGIAYVIDKVTGQCWIRNITLQDYDNRDIDSTHVRLRTPAEFFDLDRGNYSYVGQVGGFDNLIKRST